MLVGAGFLSAWDKLDRRNMLAQLKTDDFGFRELPDGTWLWDLYQEPLVEELESVRGPVVSLANMGGVPWVRFRSAIPATLLRGKIPETLGRKKGLDPEWVEEAKPRIDELEGILYRFKACACGTRVADDSEKVEDPTTTEDLLSGTAMILAFIFSRNILPIKDIGVLQAKAARYFLERVPDLASDFQDLVERMKVLMHKENINLRLRWWRKARLWRLVFSQSKEGFWEPNDDTVRTRKTREETPTTPRVLHSLLFVSTTSLPVLTVSSPPTRRRSP